jgi:hypothetical protein
VRICLVESCYDTADISVECIVDILSEFDLTSSDLHLFVFLLRTVTRFTKSPGMLEDFPKVYKHGSERYITTVYTGCVYIDQLMLLRIAEIPAVYITKNYKLFFNSCGTGMLTDSKLL